MALTRRRRKELQRLRREAEQVWDEQKELLDQAAKVMRKASKQAANYAREEVGPRLRDTYEDRVAPAVGAGLTGARSAVHGARDKLGRDVLPAVSGALGTALAAIEVAKDKHVRQAVSKASKLGAKTGVVAPKPAGPGPYILIGLGVVAVAAVAYAAWQTLRADDDLWIEDEPMGLATDDFEGAPDDES